MSDEIRPAPRPSRPRREDEPLFASRSFSTLYTGPTHSRRSGFEPRSPLRAGCLFDSALAPGISRRDT